ncbi:transcriptional regulatory Pro-1 [Fusarium albosuccineum]|uniref:Transcriptional regulatory Pro-1 n=1 Tax=Fusarium albosuccineum TaxID=1237068 RepID=A0A8H4L2P7_9HYPO|nr:transcriptional regulatory Pro-1 [Fusarium albosuccineum]
MEHSRLILAQNQLENLLDWFEQRCVLAPASLHGRITAAFRIAARIYLYGLASGHDRFSKTQELSEELTGVLRSINTDPKAYDHNLVWVYLVGGANCTRTSSFRKYFDSRLDRYRRARGQSTYQSMKRIATILEEVWQQKDNAQDLSVKDSEDWRDVMSRNGWVFLTHLVAVEPLQVKI